MARKQAAPKAPPTEQSLPQLTLEEMTALADKVPDSGWTLVKDNPTPNRVRSYKSGVVPGFENVAVNVACIGGGLVGEGRQYFLSVVSTRCENALGVSREPGVALLYERVDAVYQETQRRAEVARVRKFLRP